MQHYHQYEYREPQPRSSELVRDRLRQKPRRTFDTVDDAVAWHEKWIGEVKRPAGCWGEDGEEARRPRLLEHTRRQLEYGTDTMDAFWSGGEVIAVTLIPCPPRVIPGFPTPPPCPVGRS